MKNNVAFEINVDDISHFTIVRVEYLITYTVGIAAELGDLEEEEKPGLLRLKDRHIGGMLQEAKCFLTA
jgi:hypothetical protein